MVERLVDKTASVKLFTHDDLDGVSCAVLAGLYFEDVCDVEICSYNNINEKLENFFSSSEKWKYDLIFITDISCNEEVATIINSYNDLLNVRLLDHHKTAEWLSENYSWATVIIEKNNHLCSGTSLFAEYLGIDRYSDITLFNYVDLVRQYDTWEWKENNEFRANNLNRLFHFLGKERFINDMVQKIPQDYIFDDKYNILFIIDDENKKLYFEKKEKEIIPYTIKDKTFGLVFANEYVSELGNYLNEKYPRFSGIILVGEYGISYRTIHDDIDMSEIAKMFGGGGHRKASGSGISSAQKKEYLDILFRTYDKEVN